MACASFFLFVVCGLLCVVWFQLFLARCLVLCVICWLLLFVACCMLFVVSCVLRVDRCASCVAWRCLFVVGCLFLFNGFVLVVVVLFVVCCL